MKIKILGAIIVLIVVGSFLVLTSAPHVWALDIGETVQRLKGFLFGQNYLQEVTEGEFLLEGKHQSFQAYFGDRASGGKHRIKLVKEDLGFEFAFIEATQSAFITSGLPSAEISTSSSLLNKEASLSAEQKKVLDILESQLEEIESSQASIEANIKKLEEEVNSIDKEIKNIIPGTDIGYDEVNQNQLVVKNSNLQPGLDVYYWKRENDLREKIIIRYPPAPDKIIFSLKNQGLTPFDIGAGVIYFKDTNGRYLFRITKGYVKDLLNQYSNNVMTFIEDNKLVHKLDPQWVSAPERVYPLVVYFDIQTIDRAQLTPTKVLPTVFVMPTFISTSSSELTGTPVPDLTPSPTDLPINTVTPVNIQEVIK